MYGQSDSNRGQFHETNYFVLSAEAVTRRGDKYDLFRGVQDHFAIALRVTTLEARYRSMVEDQGHRVEQWRLQLTEGERQKVFAWYIGVSEEMALDQSLSHSFSQLHHRGRGSPRFDCQLHMA